MRVFFVNRFFYPDHSATSQLLSDLAFYLAKRDVTVVVIASRQRYGDASAALPVHDVVQDVEILRVSTPTFGRRNLVGRTLDYLGFFFSATWRVFRAARRGDVVVSMTDPPLIGVTVGCAVRMRGARAVNWFQDVFPEIAERLGVPGIGVTAGLLRWLRDRSIRTASANIAIGESMAKLLEKSSGCRAVVIPNWGLEELTDIEADPPGSAGMQHSLRARWGLGESLIVGYSGNLGRAHRLDVLIESAALLRDVSGVVFLFVGDGSQRGALQARAAELGLKNVVFRPYQPRESLRESLLLPDLHVVTLDERLEGLIVPSKFVGVVALGKPVLWIGSPSGEIASLVNESRAGICVSSGDARGIANAISALRNDPDRLATMHRAAIGLWKRKLQRSSALTKWYDVLVTQSAGGRSSLAPSAVVSIGRRAGRRR